MPLIYDGDLTRDMPRTSLKPRWGRRRRVVFNTNTRIPRNAPRSRWLRDAASGGGDLANCGIPLAIVRPTVYSENLLAPPVAHAVNEHGVLPTRSQKTPRSPG